MDLFEATSTNALSDDHNDDLDLTSNPSTMGGRIAYLGIVVTGGKTTRMNSTIENKAVA